MVLNTRHTGIAVTNIEKAVTFYLGLGFQLVSRMIEEGEYIDNLVGLDKTRLEWAKLKLPDNSLLELLQYHSHPENTNDQGLQDANKLGCSHIAFTVSDIEETIGYITGNGGQIKNNYQVSPDGKVKVIYCYDLEGNILEIVQELK
jgi:catechol 2,3-dioxygenase-like lactoylglutathione lyase family enzyme